MREDPAFSMDRFHFHISARHGGSDILRLADRADAIYLSTLTNFLLDFIDRTLPIGSTSAGICKPVALLLGLGSFDADKENGYWRHFFDSKSLTAAELKEAIEGLLVRRNQAVDAAGDWDSVRASLPPPKEEAEPEPRSYWAPRPSAEMKKTPPNPFKDPSLDTKDDYTISHRPEDVQALLARSKTQWRISHEIYKLKELKEVGVARAGVQAR